jgi:hypothetical protein
MKKSIIIIVILVVIGLIAWAIGRNNDGANQNQNGTASSTSASVSGTTKVSDKLSEYKNEELGFVVKYPSAWELGDSSTATSFVIPVEKEGANTIKKLETKIMLTSGKCTFPPVTTIKERSTMTSGNLSFNMISMTNSVQGSNYFDRMYSLQNGNVCYIFSFSSITQSPASKGLKGSEATQVTNNNKAIVDSADQAFTAMVKSFAYYVGPEGKDETQVVPAKR